MVVQKIGCEYESGCFLSDYEFLKGNKLTIRYPVWDNFFEYEEKVLIPTDYKWIKIWKARKLPFLKNKLIFHYVNVKEVY